MKYCLSLLWLFVFLSVAEAADFMAMSSNWPHLQEKHFVIYFESPDADPEARAILRRAEDYYDSIADNLGYARYGNFWTWDERVRIVLFNSKEGFMNATGQPQWSQGFAMPHTGFFKSRLIVSFSNQPSFVADILPHEISHLILHDLVGFETPIPLFFDEGVAQLSQQHDDAKYLSVLAQLLVEGKTIPVTEMLNFSLQDQHDADVVSMFYVESLYIVDFLIKNYGKENFKRLCRHMRDGRGFEEAMKSAYYPTVISIEEFQQKWIKYVLGYLKQY